METQNRVLKLYGRVDSDLVKGNTYTLSIANSKWSLGALLTLRG